MKRGSEHFSKRPVERRDFLKSVGLSAASLAVSGCAGMGLGGTGADARKRDPRPDIVLVMADDMGFSDIGCYGGEIRTPNLDRLARGGLRFTQFYNTGRCCPTRASLLTGLYPHQAGVGHMMSDRGHDGYRGDLNDRCATIAEVLRAAGYGTYMAGKWHVTRQVGLWSGDEKLTSTHNWPIQRGFDRFYGTIHGGGSYYDPVSLTRGNTPIEPEGEDFYYTDAISDNAARFIAEHDAAGDGRPLFCYAAYTAPHWPMHALPGDIARYRGRYDAGWDALRAERLARMRSMGLVDPRWPLTVRDPAVPPWEQAEYKHWHRKVMEVYAAMIDRLDQGIGRIAAQLEAAGRLDNTLFLFLADNGGCAEGGTAFEKERKMGGLSQSVKTTRDGRPVRFGNFAAVMPGPADTFQEYGRPWANASNTPFRLYKHWVHEGGIATPLVVHWPERIRHGGRFEREPGHLVDIMATCVDVARAGYPLERGGKSVQPMEGRSLVPVLDGGAVGERPLFWEHEGNRAMRHGRWKLVAKGKKGGWELYDMEADRVETNDLAAAHPERTRHMAAAWLEWARRANVLPWPYGPEPELP